ncbi:hypothetical protein PG988_015118 [Apiospora saccharicola]
MRDTEEFDNEADEVMNVKKNIRQFAQAKQIINGRYTPQHQAAGIRVPKRREPPPPPKSPSPTSRSPSPSWLSAFSKELHGRFGIEFEVFVLQSQKKEERDTTSPAYVGATGTESESCGTWTRQTLMHILP